MVDESKGEEYCYSGISEMALSLEKSKKSCEIGNTGFCCTQKFTYPCENAN